MCRYVGGLCVPECLLTFCPFTVLLMYLLKTMKSPFTTMLASLSHTHMQRKIQRDGHTLTKYSGRFVLKTREEETRVSIIVCTYHTQTHTHTLSYLPSLQASGWDSVRAAAGQ